MTSGAASGPDGGYNTISFLSDYGHDDEFVGVVHSVIAAIAPHARVVDVTHGVAPCDVRAGGLALARAAQYLLPGVVLAVVDPGVGTSRRPVAVEVGEGASVLVGPDNGLLAPAVALVGGASRAVELADARFRLEAQPELGSTFDGRDVFAPAAAHLCCGVPISALGPPIDPATLMPGMLPVSGREGDDLVAEVLWIDRFGNCQLNLDPAELDELATAGSPLQVAAGEDLRTAERVSAYADVSPGRVGLLVDSSGLVSLAVPRRSVAEDLGLHEGAEVRIGAAATGGSDGAAPTATRVGLGRRPSGPARQEIGGGP
ncbi:MAG: SAM-dependent chlorinase/fluorinase [Acidimicrobiaceae bacterium]|nr:SAM-dependent chlorinase/fluorinase [Acidimicrobiaceae bacterium]